MPVTYAGRIEARCVVPTGGAAVSATIANGAAAQTVTVPAGSYYLTAAGSVNSLIDYLEGYLNTYVQGYPQTAAATASAVGYGTWTAGWLCNETSGNAAPVFGSPTMTASGTPTYANTGPQAGIDYAIGFDSAADAFDGGNVHDVGTGDICIGWVAKFDSVPSVAATIISKINAAASAGYALYVAASGNLGFLLVDSGGLKAVEVASVGVCVGEWHAGIAVIDRGAGTFRFATRGLASGTTTVCTATALSGSVTTTETFRFGSADWLATSANFKLAAAYVGTGVGAASGMSTNIATAVTNFANAVNSTWSVSLDTAPGTGRVSINWSGYTTPTWSLSWTSIDLRDLLGFTANISSVTSAQTGTKQARGLWFPDSPLNCDDHPSMAPEDTDLRSTESPTGLTIGLSGNVKYVHTNVRWDRVPVDRIREASAAYANASLEVFFRDCISGLGDHAWFRPLSPMQVYWSNAGTDTLLGADANDGAGTDGWCITGLSKFSELAKMSQPGFAGQFNVRLPRIVSVG